MYAFYKAKSFCLLFNLVLGTLTCNMVPDCQWFPIPSKNPSWSCELLK